MGKILGKVGSFKEESEILGGEGENVIVDEIFLEGREVCIAVGKTRRSKAVFEGG